ncbi:DUF2778 domain-containing protein [Aquabacter cavernae]|uniref:DUF2778 domain-containing protein n=1 Tax=Aquabacter cavernae TaxID=2496029 RepID=UPI001FDF71CA|nr:DUF2778 domain-containing protein [Aquabacter cavernae]
MTYTAWFDDEPSQEPPAHQPGQRPRASWRIAGAFAVGFAGLASAGLVGAWALAGIDGPARIPAFDEHAMALRAAQLAAEAASDAEIPPDPAPTRAAALSLVPNWLYDPNPLAGGARRAAATDSKEIALAPAPLPPAALPSAHLPSAHVPLPQNHPLSAAERQQTAEAPAAGSDARDRIAAAPVPTRNPLLSGGEQQVAALPPPASTPGPVEPPAAKAQDGSDIALPGPGDKYAVYDIKGKTVYMPSGERMEAHSGYGDGFDNIQQVSTRMVGPTPPNTYVLSMRERLFHGVQALRMRPVGEGKMYGRDGFLTHSYLMGDRGDSNGCVSFKDYDKFLAAYKSGQVTKIIVVAALANPPAPLPDANPLLAWLSGKGR